MQNFYIILAGYRKQFFDYEPIERIKPGRTLKRLLDGCTREAEQVFIGPNS